MQPRSWLGLPHDPALFQVTNSGLRPQQRRNNSSKSWVERGGAYTNVTPLLPAELPTIAVEQQLYHSLSPVAILKGGSRSLQPS